jgi:hypothetical protein
LVPEAGGWKILLDSLPDAKELTNSIASTGGFGITHTGRVERSDGQPFARSEAEVALTMLAEFFSFLCGFCKTL